MKKKEIINNWYSMLKVLIILCFYITNTVNAQSKQEQLNWFKNAKLGLFIHWGLYSQAAGEWKGERTEGGEHFMLYSRIPISEYELIANDFNPIAFDAKAWVEQAKKSGMKYIVFTTKHHDGFAMYNSLVSNYNIVNRTPFKRDPLKELAIACKENGIKLGLYYSLGRDWHHPHVPTNWPTKAGRSNTWDYPNEDGKDLSIYIEEKVKPQLVELLSNYGEIAMLWFDTFELVNKEQSKAIRELIHSKQPNCLINNRIGNGFGDYSIVEQKLTTSINNKPWEACLTMGQNWGYNKFDTVYKNEEMTIRNFVDIVSKGGNLLLNIGPTGLGSFPKQSTITFDALHNWLDINGEAIFYTHPWRLYGEELQEKSHLDLPKVVVFNDAIHDETPKDNTPDLRFTAKGNDVYVITRSLVESNFTVKSVSKNDKVQQVKLLGSNKKIKWKQTENGLQINLPDDKPSLIPIYVFKLSRSN